MIITYNDDDDHHDDAPYHYDRSDADEADKDEDGDGYNCDDNFII